MLGDQHSFIIRGENHVHLDSVYGWIKGASGVLAVGVVAYIFLLNSVRILAHFNIIRSMKLRCSWAFLCTLWFPRSSLAFLVMLVHPRINTGVLVLSCFLCRSFLIWFASFLGISLEFLWNMMHSESTYIILHTH